MPISPESLSENSYFFGHTEGFKCGSFRCVACVRRVTLSVYAYKVDGRKEKKNELKNIFYISFLIPRLYLPDNNNERSTKIFLMFLAKSNRLRITKKFKTLVVLCLR